MWIQHHKKEGAISQRKSTQVNASQRKSTQVNRSGLKEGKGKEPKSQRRFQGLVNTSNRFTKVVGGTGMLNFSGV